MIKNKKTLIYDTGRPPLIVCLLCTIAGGASIWFGIAGVADQPLRAWIPVVFGVAMISCWFWQTRIFYDHQNRCLTRGWAKFGWLVRTIQVEEVTGVYRHNVRMKTSAVSGVDFGLLFQEGRREWLTRISLDQADSIGTLLSQTLAVPLFPEYTIDEPLPHPKSIGESGLRD